VKQVDKVGDLVNRGPDKNNAVCVLEHLDRGSAGGTLLPTVAGTLWCDHAKAMLDTY
jgi:hypothetical protein